MVMYHRRIDFKIVLCLVCHGFIVGKMCYKVLTLLNLCLVEFINLFQYSEYCCQKQ
jgi:hypothetical protein